VAKVLAIGTECDIALLTVEDDAFWEGSEAIELGDLPRLQDDVTVVGYPIGGDTISVTSGVVSRIEVTQYTHGSSELLGIQVSAISPFPTYPPHLSSFPFTALPRTSPPGGMSSAIAATREGEHVGSRS